MTDLSYNTLYIVTFVQTATLVHWAARVALCTNLPMYCAQQPPMAYILNSIVLVPEFRHMGNPHERYHT
jgi:hypothetical protein